jgi:hypothetical protein
MPMINTISLSVGLIYVLVCAATLVARRRDPANPGFKGAGGYPAGILAIAAAAAMAVFAFLQTAETSQTDGFEVDTDRLMVAAGSGPLPLLQSNAPASRGMRPSTSSSRRAALQAQLPGRPCRRPPFAAQIP